MRYVTDEPDDYLKQKLYVGSPNGLESARIDISCDFKMPKLNLSQAVGTGLPVAGSTVVKRKELAPTFLGRRTY